MIEKDNQNISEISFTVSARTARLIGQENLLS